ncbi:uncharacterized protein il11b [Centropristis striata]|uniref:uncharacterized protein il11b n=1 Tax=Centropristis striata TaxID=184440 RepID=UPI0027DF005E|nr:uncharacterized protein il11b [Centropristis striata]
MDDGSSSSGVGVRAEDWSALVATCGTAAGKLSHFLSDVTPSVCLSVRSDDAGSCNGFIAPGGLLISCILSPQRPGSKPETVVPTPESVQHFVFFLLVISVIHDFTPCLVHLLLLAELFVHSSSRPTNHSPLCSLFKSMISQVDSLASLAKKLHDLSDEELVTFEAMDNRLAGLPHIEHTATHFHSLKMNESLSQLSVYTQSFRLHLDWLKTAKENVSLSSQSAGGASSHLLQLSNILNTSLQQISEEVPQSASPSLPVVSTAFDVLQFSVEISQQLKVFSDWSKRVLASLQRLSHCPRR